MFLNCYVVGVKLSHLSLIFGIKEVSHIEQEVVLLQIGHLKLPIFCLLGQFQKINIAAMRNLKVLNLILLLFGLLLTRQKGAVSSLELVGITRKPHY